MTRKLLAAAALLAAAPAAMAEPAGYLDLFYVPSAEIEDSGAPGTRDGDGFGVRGMAPISYDLGLTGEYQATTYEGGADVEQARVGLCLVARGGNGVILEYIAAELDGVEADGFGAHLRLDGPLLYGQAGYVSLRDDVEDHNGLEVTFGLLLKGRGGQTGVFAEMHRTELEGQDSGIQTTLTDFRAGLRIAF